MSCKSSVLAAMRELNFTASTKLVFFYLERMTECHEDRRTAAASRYLAEEIGIGEKAVRVALKSLEKAGWISVDRISRESTRVTMLYRVKGAGKGAVNYVVNQHDLIDLGAGKGATGVTGVKTLISGVDVVDVDVKEIKDFAAPKMSAAERSARSGQPLKDPDKKYVGYTLATKHICAKWATQHNGAKMPVTIGDMTQFGKLCKDRPAAALAALFETFVTEKDPFWKAKGFSLRMFANRVSAVITNDPGHLKRAAALEKSWFGEIKSPELKEHEPKAAIMRQTEVEPDYRPEEVQFSADLKARLRAMPEPAGLKR